MGRKEGVGGNGCGAALDCPRAEHSADRLAPDQCQAPCRSKPQAGQSVKSANWIATHWTPRFQSTKLKSNQTLTNDPQGGRGTGKSRGSGGNCCSAGGGMGSPTARGG